MPCSPQLSVIICQHATLLQCYSLYSLRCTFYLCDLPIITGSLYLLIPLTYVSHPPPPIPSGDYQFVLSIYGSASVLFLCFVFKMPHISEYIFSKTLDVCVILNWYQFYKTRIGGSWLYKYWKTKSRLICIDSKKKFGLPW